MNGLHYQGNMYKQFSYDIKSHKIARYRLLYSTKIENFDKFDEWSGFCHPNIFC